MTRAIAVVDGSWQVAWLEDKGLQSFQDGCGAFQVRSSMCYGEVLKALQEAITMCRTDETYSYEHTWQVGEFTVHKHSWSGISMIVNHCRVLFSAQPVHVVEAIYKASQKSYDEWVSGEKE